MKLTGLLSAAKEKNRKNEWRQAVEGKEKEVLMSMVERGGKVYLRHVANTGKWTLLNQIKENVDISAKVYTDELPSYVQLPKFGYYHKSVVHNRNQYVKGEIHTQNIENVWSHLKRGAYGVYRKVSPKYLQAYTDEYSFRHSNRNSAAKMFDLILSQVPKIKMLRV